MQFDISPVAWAFLIGFLLGVIFLRVVTYLERGKPVLYIRLFEGEIYPYDIVMSETDRTEEWEKDAGYSYVPLYR
jgi:hypothetical protein